MDEEVYPVCSPAMLGGKNRLREPGGLAQVTLIHDLSMDGHAGFPTWDAWLRKAGVANISASRGLKINNSAAVLQAAIDGHGVALARSVMVRDDLMSGRLIRLFGDVRFSSPLAYYIVYRNDCAALPRTKAFREWLLREAAN